MTSDRFRYLLNLCAHCRYLDSIKTSSNICDEKDLGVTFDPELKFEDHMSGKVRKANAIVGLIRRSFSFLDCKLFKKLYTTFVRPHLEYAQSVWAPLICWKMCSYERLNSSTDWVASTILND